jgi:LysM repeat protein
MRMGSKPAGKPKQRTTVRDIVLGAAVGLGVGMMALAGILALARPWGLLGLRPTASATAAPTPAVLAMATATSVPKPTATLRPVPDTPAPGEQPRFVEHTVVQGDSLLALSVRYDVSVDAIVAANPIIEDAEYLGLGWVLQIPLYEGAVVTPAAGGAATASPEAESTPQARASGAWQPFPVEGDIDAVYTVSQDFGRFTLHYAPDTLPAEDPQAVAGLVSAGLAHIEQMTGAQLDEHFDAYAAGDLFASPNQALRGHSFSSSLRYHFLYDGSGDAADRQYIIAHELTHLFAWNTFGRPVSAMLSEGLAVYMGSSLAEQQGGMLTLDEFCALYYQAGELPRVSTDLQFGGHIRDLPNYNAAGCFVKYLIETDGAAAFGRLYPGGDFAAVYGQSLGQLETAWLAEVAATQITSGLYPEDFVVAVNDVGGAFEQYFATFSGAAEERAAYWELDAARVALAHGDLDGVEAHLQAAEVGP